MINIIEGNSIIAEYLGLITVIDQVDPVLGEVRVQIPEIFKGIEEEFDYLYLYPTEDISKYHGFHKNWNILMPVIEHLEQIKFEDKEGDDDEWWKNKCSLWTFTSNLGVRFNRYQLHKEETFILSAFAAVVEVCKMELSELKNKIS